MYLFNFQQNAHFVKVQRKTGVSMSNKTLAPFSDAARQMKVGIYEHYKKLPYEVLGVCRHSETLEEMVVYRALYGEKEMWVRPLEMFLESIEIDGVKQPRFRFVK